MISPKDLESTIKQLQGSGKTFAEFLAEIFKGKFIEIYLGDAYEEISTEQVSMEYPAVFCGKVVAAYRECLIINAAYINKDRHLKLGNMLFINERSIRALNEVDDNGIIEDMLLRSNETIDIKAYFIDHKPGHKIKR